MSQIDVWRPEGQPLVDQHLASAAQGLLVLGAALVGDG
jgi:hypothetical protein